MNFKLILDCIIGRIQSTFGEFGTRLVSLGLKWIHRKGLGQVWVKRPIPSLFF